MNKNAVRWKPIVLAIALGALAIALTWVLTRPVESPGHRWQTWVQHHPAFGWTIIGTLAAAAIIALLTGFDRRPATLLRLDWYVPMLRRQATSTPSSPTLAG